MSFAALKEKLRGVAFTTATPFSQDQKEVQYERLQEHIQSLSSVGGGVFIPCGNTGEYYSLTDDERVGVVRATVQGASEDDAVVGGAAGSTKTVLDLADRYQEAGVDAIMVMHPDHTYIHEQGLLDYYERIADAVDCGVVLYKRGPELSDEVISELTLLDNVVAVKYAVNDIEAFSDLVESSPGDVVWSNGIAERFAPAYALEGAEGFTTGIGNFVPEATLALMEAICEEDWGRAKQIREVLRPYEKLRDGTGDENRLSAANNVPAVKYGMELTDRYGGPVREPLTELSKADRKRAKKYYEEIQSANLEPIASAD
ncbi:dihydrodipicolinate synthase family protein [Halobacterium noricense]|uniref:dihydrodipicolinate synthase family protein n=1 Tax=Halobacterium noricense TaxID=223182 RepID=UPI001E62D945|nr:dihydrodipicolinate synthase family protein [Halobacterium noricense]UHH23915.1 dihydrodipicolinate synthase family protein [Halobacterium noricense]